MRSGSAVLELLTKHRIRNGEIVRIELVGQADRDGRQKTLKGKYRLTAKGVAERIIGEMFLRDKDSAV